MFVGFFCVVFFLQWSTLSVLLGHSVFFIYVTTANDLRLQWIAKQGNNWYHFYFALVWRGPWLGIERGTSNPRAIILLLGYRGGGVFHCHIDQSQMLHSSKYANCWLYVQGLKTTSVLSTVCEISLTNVIYISRGKCKRVLSASSFNST